jgi:hypothetical protein
MLIWAIPAQLRTSTRHCFRPQVGAANVFLSNNRNCIYVKHTHLSCTTEFSSSAQVITNSDDKVTVVASNVSTGSTRLYKARALAQILTQSEFSGGTFCFNIKDAIADSGVMQIL